MRKLGSLLQLFNENQIPRIKYKNGLDMLLRENFDVLKMCIEARTLTDDLKVKAGLKHGLHYTIRNAATIWKETFLVQRSVINSKEMDDFVTILDLFKEFVFGDASYHINRARQINLRKPEKLPIEGDVKLLRATILESIEKVTSDIYTLIDKHLYVELRNAICVRLKIYNGRRGGEPARLFIEEFQDAINDKWIDKQRSQNLDPLDKALLDKINIGHQGRKGNNHLVSDFIPKDCIKGMHVLCDRQIRTDVGISKTNKYAFPSINMSDKHVSGWHTLEAVCK